nr:MAG TPA: hypothetical protein [Caudoviricetes sp.]
MVFLLCSYRLVIFFFILATLPKLVRNEHSSLCSYLKTV